MSKSLTGFAFSGLKKHLPKLDRVTPVYGVILLLMSFTVSFVHAKCGRTESNTYSCIVHDV